MISTFAALRKSSRASAKGLRLDSHALGHFEIEIAKWYFVDALAFDFAKLSVAISASCENDGKIRVGVGMSAAHAASEDHGSRIEQRLVAVFDGIEPGQECIELLDLVGLQCDEMSNRFLVVPVVRHAVI